MNKSTRQGSVVVRPERQPVAMPMKSGMWISFQQTVSHSPTSVWQQAVDSPEVRNNTRLHRRGHSE